MSVLQTKFKTNFINSLLELVKRTWLKMAGVYLGITIATYLVTTILVLIGLALLGELGRLSLDDLFVYGISKFISLSDWISFDNIIMTIVIYLAIIMVIGLLPISWMSYLFFLFIKEGIKNQESTIKETIPASFNVKVLKIGILNILISLFFVGMWLIVTTVLDSWFLLLIVVPVTFVISLKALLVLPAYCLGDMSYLDSFRFSFKNMTTKRCIKLTLYGIAIIIVIAIIDYIFSHYIPYSIRSVFLTFDFIIEFLISGILASIYYSFMAGLFYRYVDNETSPIVEEGD